MGLNNVHTNVATGKPKIVVVEAAPKPSDTDAGVAALNFFGGEAPPEGQSSDHDGTAEAPLPEPELAQHDADAFDMGKGPKLDINGLVSEKVKFTGLTQTLGQL